jgi:hypothetical protein
LTWLRSSRAALDIRNDPRDMVNLLPPAGPQNDPIDSKLASMEGPRHLELGPEQALGPRALRAGASGDPALVLGIYVEGTKGLSRRPLRGGE